MILIKAYEGDKYTNTAYSMFRKSEIFRALILQKTEVVRVNVVKKNRINIRILVKSIIWKF